MELIRLRQIDFIQILIIKFRNYKQQLVLLERTCKQYQEIVIFLIQLINECFSSIELKQIERKNLKGYFIIEFYQQQQEVKYGMFEQQHKIRMLIIR
ncbi:unnamed protein product [Paramecium sonneborni]|uniref:Uncharacterized protein n=1 Tax=Paramecium sonneborni TaxID=65129 RepID=A0A8S1LX98_9CILI|nr:unnamed protein product [Paramecium sonneborni]